MYEIVGLYRNNVSEVLDTADNKVEAITLAHEYRLAFGDQWIIKIKRK